MHRESAVAEDNTHPLKEYVDACLAHKWFIAAIAGGCALAAAVWSFVQTPIFDARATVVVESQSPGGLDKERYQNHDYSPEYFQTHFELLKSHEVLRRTAQLLKLSQRPEYESQPSLLQMITPAWVSSLWVSESGDGQASAEEERLLKQFASNVEIFPIRGARLAHVRVSSIDAGFAALAANTLVSVYIDRNQELTSISREQSARWFTTHLDDLRDKVQASQQALYLYRVKHGLLTGEERKSLTGHTLAELNSQLVKTEMAKAEAQSRLQQIEAALNTQGKTASAVEWSDLDSIGQVLNSHLIQTLRAQEITLSSQVADLSDKYGPLHPDRTQKNVELQSMRQRIKQEVQKIYDSLKHDYNMAANQERAVRAAIARYGTDKIRSDRDEIEHGMLEREAESSLHVYNLFLKATKESDFSAGMRANNVYLADPAIASVMPAKPKTKLNIALALLVGAMGGVALAIVRDSSNKKLDAPADIERYMPEVSLLGVMPLVRNARKSQAMLVGGDARTPVAESIRIIRTGLLLSSPGTLPARILITSPGDNEGKTTLAINLAMAMAQLETHRVILVDMDFRKAAAHPIYEVESEHRTPFGLAHLLRGEAGVADVVHDSLIPNLSVIPRGDRPRNPTEMLHSKQFERLLDSAKESGSHMIIDCPPTLPFADTAVLASKVDGVLVVVGAGETTREACRLTIQRLTQAGGKILGLVMQKARHVKSPYYSYASSKNGLLTP